MPFLEYNIFKRSLILLITFSCLSQTMVSNGSKQCNIVELYINLWLKLNVWEVIQVYFHYSGLLIKLYSYHGKPLLNWQEFQCIVLFFQCDAATRTFLRVHLVGHSLGWAAFCTSHYSYKDILFYFFECDCVTQTTKTKSARPLTALSKSTYRTYPAPSLVLWPTDQPAWLLSAKAPLASLPVSSGF